MKKNSFILNIIFLLLLIGDISAQDTLSMQNGEKKTVLVTKVGIREVEYKRMDNQSGPTYTVLKSDISTIVYLNGTKDDFGIQSPGLFVLPTTLLTIKDVEEAKEVCFYGFDFSHFRLLEPKRTYEAAKIRDVNFPAWNQFAFNAISNQKLAEWFGKQEVDYDINAVTKMNAGVSDKNVVAAVYTLNLDSIKYSVMQYDKPKNNKYKIGVVVNVEHFDKNLNEATGYVTFFDISNGAVIYSEKVLNNAPNGMGLTNYWGPCLIEMVKDFKSGVRIKAKGW